MLYYFFKKKIRKSDYDGHRATISAFKRLRLEYCHELEASQRGMMKPCLKTNPQIVTSKCKFAPVLLPAQTLRPGGFSEKADE